MENISVAVVTDNENYGKALSAGLLNVDRSFIVSLINKDEFMIKMKKSAALILAGVLACSMPMPVMASSDTEVVESLLDSGIDFLASDPGKAVDIIMYAKDLVDQQNITDDQVRSAITQAADHFSVTLSSGTSPSQ